MRAACLVAAAALCLLLAGGCGEGGGTTAADTTVKAAAKQHKPHEDKKKPHGFGPELQVSLDGVEGAQNVGVLLAEEKGLFAKAGLKVWTGTPLYPERPIPYVVEEVDDIAITQEPQLALAREEGEPVVGVGGVVSQPTAAMIWLPESGIRSIADLEGKTIGVPGVPFQRELLEWVLAEAGLSMEDVEVEGVGYESTPDLLSGEVDALFGGSANVEGKELEAHGVKPVIEPVSSLGIPDYEELVVVVREDRLAREPARIHRFMAAVARGTALAIKNPEAAVDVLDASFQPEHELSRKTIAAQVAATLPLLNRTGAMDPGKARGLVDWMSAEGMLSTTSPSALIAPGFR